MPSPKKQVILRKKILMSTWVCLSTLLNLFANINKRRRRTFVISFRKNFDRNYIFCEKITCLTLLVVFIFVCNKAKKLLLFLEIRVTRQIFTGAASNLFFLIDFPEVFFFLLWFLLLFCILVLFCFVFLLFFLFVFFIRLLLQI